MLGVVLVFFEVAVHLYSHFGCVSLGCLEVVSCFPVSEPLSQICPSTPQRRGETMWPLFEACLHDTCHVIGYIGYKPTFCTSLQLRICCDEDQCGDGIFDALCCCDCHLAKTLDSSSLDLGVPWIEMPKRRKRKAFKTRVFWMVLVYFSFYSFTNKGFEWKNGLPGIFDP